MPETRHHAIPRREIQMNRLTTLLMTLALITIALTGCLPASNPLEGTEWRLAAWSVSSSDPSAFTITVAFADGQLSGSGGVNRYGGTYQAGPGDRFSVSPLTATLMGGPEPAMRAESNYLTLLNQATSYQVSGSRLTLFDANGNESLIFERSDR